MQDVQEGTVERPQVALVLAFDAGGRLLLGHRRDGSGWTLAGGHVEDDECPDCAARRELWEEAGLRAYSMSPAVGVRPNPPEYPELHVYTAMVSGLPHPHLDPDAECDEWRFFDVADGLDPEIYDSLAGPPGDQNVVRQLVRRGAEVSPEDEVSADTEEGRDTEKSEVEDLKKVGVTSEDTAQRMRPHTPSGWEGHSKVESFDLGNGLHHHVFHREPIGHGGYQPVLHAISRSPDPLDDYSMISTASAGVQPMASVRADDPAWSGYITNAVPWQDGHVCVVGESATQPGMHRQGYGTHLYRAMLRYHGRLASDKTVSAGASKVWEKLKGDPDTHVETSYDPNRAHWAEYTGPRATPTRTWSAEEHHRLHPDPNPWRDSYGKWRTDPKPVIPLKDLVTKSEDLAKSDLLDHHDPRERELAVRTGQLSHADLLRAALDDDHNVRLAALARPEVSDHTLRLLACARRLRGGAHPGRAIVDYLTHPAATKEHAQLALDAARAHGAGAEEAAQIAQERLGLPEVAKTEYDLEKMQPTIALPALGIEDRRETPVVTDETQLESKMRAMKAAAANAAPDAGAAERTRERWEGDIHGMFNQAPVLSGAVSGVPGTKASWSLSDSLRQGLGGNHMRGKTSQAATQIHENFHHVMQRVEERYGKDARRQLARHMVENLPPELQERIVHHAKTMGYHPDSPHLNEEAVALLHNYMNDWQHRDWYHGKIEDNDAADQQLRQAYHQVRRHAATIGPEWIGQTQKSELDAGTDLDKAAGVDDPDNYLYHVTYHGRLPSIAETGLQPNQGRGIGTGAYDSNRQGRVFFAEPDGVFHWHSLAEDHAEAGSDDPVEDGLVPVVLRARRRAVGRTQEDEVANRESIHSNAVYKEGQVGPQHLQVYNGKAWVPINQHEDLPIGSKKSFFPASLHPDRRAERLLREEEKKKAADPVRQAWHKACTTPGARVKTKHWGNGTVLHPAVKPGGDGADGLIHLKLDSGGEMGMNSMHVVGPE